MNLPIKKIRQDLGLTQGQFSSILGISIPTLCRAEKTAKIDAHTGALIRAMSKSSKEQIREIIDRNRLPGWALIEILRVTK